MTVTYIKGNLFTYEGLDAYAHGCNCAGAMGKGIAVEFKKRYPSMFIRYKELCKYGIFKPGLCFTWYDIKSKKIFNLGTQEHWKTKATLWAIENSLNEMLEDAKFLGVKRIGMPRIGAGLGGLNWDDVKEVIDKAAKDSEIELVVFEEYIQ